MTVNKIRHPYIWEIKQMAELWQIHFGGTKRQLYHLFCTALNLKHSLIIKRPGDHRIAGQVFWYVCLLGGKKVACIFGLCVKPELQHQGLGTALMEAAHELLKREGFCAVILEPLDEDLVWFYHYFGYKMSGGYSSFFAKAGTPVNMSVISPREYHRLRRKYLPENGLELPLSYFKYRSREVTYYRGENFICAIEKDEWKQCLELLGDSSAAGGIAEFPERPHLRFTAPGDEEYTLMVLNLAGDIPSNLYSGFPLE